MAAQPWSEFAVGTKSENPKWTEPTCRPLKTVSHVTHVSSAPRVLEDGELRAQLVFDESKLNTERIMVVWLSPNYWTNGFRYGGLCFKYDFDTLVAGRRYYWVESIAYGIPACRILVTDIDRDALLDAYDPTTGDGPWWRDSDGSHYWNGEKTLEIMFEGDLPIAHAESTDLVKHHESMCSIDAKRCPERGMEAHTAGGRVLAAVLSRPIDAALLQWTEDNVGKTEPSHVLRVAFQAFLTGLPTKKAGHFSGSVSSGTEQAHAIVRAVGGAVGDKAQVSALLALFDSRASFDAAAVEVVGEIFGLTDPSQVPF